MKHLGFVKKRWFLVFAGALAATLLLLGIRFFTYSMEHTHYHANFAVYIYGQREEFKQDFYYQEVSACTLDGPIKPAQRAHMHENNNAVVHVHDDGATWQQFFNNIGWSIGPDFIQNQERKLYVADEANKLNIVLNGDNLTDLTTINNEVIKSEDRLLISFGEIDDKTLDKEYKSIATSAHHYNTTPDPASCAGQMDHLTVKDRFKHLF